jgi:hypothetical protein
LLLLTSDFLELVEGGGKRILTVPDMECGGRKEWKELKIKESIKMSEFPDSHFVTQSSKEVVGFK